MAIIVLLVSFKRGLSEANTMKSVSNVNVTIVW